MKKINLICTTNEKYFPYYKSLINSIQENSKFCINSIISYFINFESIELKEFIQKKYENGVYIIPTFLKEELDSKENRFCRYDCKLLNGRLMSEEFAFCNNLRYFMIPELISSEIKKDIPINFLYIDVDNIIMKDLSPLIELIDENDICIYKYPITDHPIDWRKFTTYACGLIGFNSNFNSLRFFQDLKQEIINNDPKTVGDQLDFYNVYNRNYKFITLKKLELMYKDDRFTENGIIWSGDGNRKQFPKFQEIQKKYELI